LRTHSHSIGPAGGCAESEDVAVVKHTPGDCDPFTRVHYVIIPIATIIVGTRGARFPRATGDAAVV